MAQKNSASDRENEKGKERITKKLIKQSVEQLYSRADRLLHQTNPRGEPEGCSCSERVLLILLPIQCDEGDNAMLSAERNRET